MCSRLLLIPEGALVLTAPNRMGEGLMSFYGSIKKNAKLALKGRRGAGALAAMFVVGAAGALTAAEFAALRAFAPSPSYYWQSGEAAHDYFLRVFFGYSPQELAITCLAVILYAALLAPLALGWVRWHYVLIQGSRPAFRELFHFFGSGRMYARAVWHNVQLAVRCLGWGIVFLSLPGGLLSICVRFLSIDTITRATRLIASVGVLVALGLMVLMAILYAIYIGKYSLSGYLLCESDEITVSQALSDSARYTRGYRGVKFLFTLSFAGWYLLVPLTFFVALLFVLPYHMAAQAVFARYLTGLNRDKSEPTAHAHGRGTGEQITREFGGAALG